MDKTFNIISHSSNTLFTERLRINVGNGPVTGWDAARLLPGCYPVVAWATVPQPYPIRTLTVPHPYP